MVSSLCMYMSVILLFGVGGRHKHMMFPRLHHFSEFHLILWLVVPGSYQRRRCAFSGVSFYETVFKATIPKLPRVFQVVAEHDIVWRWWCFIFSFFSQEIVHLVGFTRCLFAVLETLVLVVTRRTLICTEHWVIMWSVAELSTWCLWMKFSI